MSLSDPPASPALRYAHSPPPSPGPPKIFNFPRQNLHGTPNSAPQTARAPLSQFGRRFCPTPLARHTARKMRTESPRVATLRQAADKRLPASSLAVLMRDLFPGRISATGPRYVPEEEVFFAVEKVAPAVTAAPKTGIRQPVPPKTAPPPTAAVPDPRRAHGEADAAPVEASKPRKWIEPWKNGFGQQQLPLTDEGAMMLRVMMVLTVQLFADLWKRDLLEKEIKELKRHQWDKDVAAGVHTGSLVSANKREVWLRTPAATRRTAQKRGYTSALRQQTVAAKRMEQQQALIDQRLQRAEVREARKADAETGQVRCRISRAPPECAWVLQRRRSWKMVVAVSSVTDFLVNTLAAHHAAAQQRALMQEKARMIQKLYRMHTLHMRIYYRKVLGRVVERAVFKHRMKKWFKWRKQGPPLILRFLHDVSTNPNADPNDWSIDIASIVTIPVYTQTHTLIATLHYA